MDQQPHPDDPCPLWKQQPGIEENSGPGMQGMESEAASGRVIYRICQQMIQVDKQRGDHNQPDFKPVLYEDQPCHQSGKKKMEYDMDDGTHHVYYSQPKLRVVNRQEVFYINMINIIKIKALHLQHSGVFTRAFTIALNCYRN